MQWVTQRRPKIDRLASPWLIRRFIDPQAQFLFVPAAEIGATALATGAVAFDAPRGTPGVELIHPTGGTSFDAIRAKFGVTDPAIARIAALVREADNDNPRQPTPEAAGLRAISLGLARSIRDDQARLAYGFTLYDALYLWASEQPLMRRRHPARGLALWIARRRERRALGRLDDRLLRDLGVTRDDARRESAQPFWRA